MPTNPKKQPRSVYDSALSLKASAAVTTSAAGSLIVDLGPGEWEGYLDIDVTAMDIVSNDEKYDIILQGSPDAAFGTAGNIVELMQFSLSAKEVKVSDSDKDDVIGHYVKPVKNLDFDGTPLRYMRIYTVVAGTTPTITYSAYLSKG